MDSMIADTPHGSFSWWLRLTAPPGAQAYDRAGTVKEREHLRRAALTSWTAPFVFFAPLLLLQQAGNISTFIAIVVLMAMAVVSLICNRANQQVIAALLLVASMDAVIEGALVTASGGLSTGWLLSFDLLVIPLITAGVLLNRRWLWFLALLHISFILGDFYLLPHSTDLNQLIVQWHGQAIAFARPILIQIGCCLLSFLEVGSTDKAIKRADRAQLIADLQASITGEKEQLERNVQEVVQILSQAANGKYISGNFSQDSSFWRIQNALSMLFARLQNTKASEQTLQQAMSDMEQLIAALQAARSHQPATWPMPNGGLLDPLTRELRKMAGLSNPPQSYTRRFV